MITVLLNVFFILLACVVVPLAAAQFFAVTECEPEHNWEGNDE